MRAQPVVELAHRPVQDRMHCVRRQFRQGRQDKRPLVQTGVRRLHVIGSNHRITQEQQIEIKRARRIAKAPRPAQASFNAKERLDQPCRVQCRLQFQDGIQECRLVLVTDRVRLVER